MKDRERDIESERESEREREREKLGTQERHRQINTGIERNISS